LDHADSAIYFALLGKSGDDYWKIFQLHEGAMLVGRARECYIRLRDKGVRDYHAEITLNGAELRISDLGNKSETKVNGAELTYGRSYLLHDQDKITLGDDAKLTVSAIDLPFDRNVIEDAIGVDPSRMRTPKNRYLLRGVSYAS